MAVSKNKFTLKIIFSYLTLVALSLLVGMFLYSEFKKYNVEANEKQGEKKFIETGMLINLVYETDGFSRLALLTESDIDYDKYTSKTDSLFSKIEEIKLLTSNAYQLKQLDSVKTLLEEKNRNIEQLRILRLTNKKDSSLDDIMREVRKLEASIGLNSVESMVKNPSKLSESDRKVWESYAEYLNSNSLRDTSTVKSKTVDSMLTASRYIVAEAKKATSRISKSLAQKENELIRNDLNISERLREIIASFDREITKNNTLEKQQRAASISRTSEILKFAGVLGGIVVLLFSYFILSDFFKAERFKKNLEEAKNYAESLLKSREQLISTVSHDLKTPLNTIKGYAELFENSTLSAKQQYYLAQITSSSQFILHLVDDLLDYSKLEAGKLPIENVIFSLENIITETGNAAQQLHLEKPITLKVTISDNLKGQYFENDPLRIRQIINNLVGNAFKFTEKGTIEIKVEEIEKSTTTSKIKISVIDTGIGISTEKQQLIFNEFTQAETHTANKFGGSGLGLAISKKLTKLLGGTLQVESVLGQGSTFVLLLPMKKATGVLSQATLAKPQALTALKGIIIDDDEAMRALLVEICEQMNISSQTYGSFEDFAASAIVGDFDFLLTDIQMPNTDGFTVLEYCKQGKIDAYTNQAIIAMTGSKEHNKAFYLEKGFADMLSKPFSKQELLKVLKKLFSDKINTPEDLNRNTNDQKSPIKTEKFDLSILKSFLNTPKALEEVLTVFNTQTNTDLKQLRVCITEKDIDKIKEISHRMLTMFRQLRSEEVILILEKMENYSTQEVDTQNLKLDYEKLTLNIRDLQKALKDRHRYDSI